ncbi:hypothetical protein [Terriglobus sp.]|uniref:hypothetical protein n=1 Tax=Terriglobus sp. TaxID=1889013 RepID=UPI003AFFA210
MFEFLLVVVVVAAIGGMLLAFDSSRDVFHPIMYLAPMLLLVYAWMPFQLLREDGLERFFDKGELVHVQLLNALGVIAFVACCVLPGLSVRRFRPGQPLAFSRRVMNRLLLASFVLGTVGLACWMVTIINVGGIVNAFSTAYAGGYDDSGYVRDGAMLLLVGVLLAVTVLAAKGPKLASWIAIAAFGVPWMCSAVLMGRRGPTFGFTVVVMMGWFFARGKRPPVLITAVSGLLLGWLVLFLVTNRQSIYLGSDFDVKTDVGEIVDKPQTGNEFIYGTGTVLSSERRDHYFWMRRYLAQLLVRPIPTAVWPTKYADFGVPELLHNAGTGEGFGDTLGWEGAPGSAPGIIADLWLEVWWFAIPFMGVLGWCYGAVWRKAVLAGGPWTSIYVILAALSIYLVMQTMEAVIFRTLELGVPCWLAWKWAQRPAVRRRSRRRIARRFAWNTETVEARQHA